MNITLITGLVISRSHMRVSDTDGDITVSVVMCLVGVLTYIVPSCVILGFNFVSLCVCIGFLLTEVGTLLHLSAVCGLQRNPGGSMLEYRMNHSCRYVPLRHRLCSGCGQSQPFSLSVRFFEVGSMTLFAGALADGFVMPLSW